MTGRDVSRDDVSEETHTREMALSGHATGDLESAFIQHPDMELTFPSRLSTEEFEAVEALPVNSALLIAHSGPNQGSRFLLDSDTVWAGRHPHADIFLDDVTVSRRHAEFRRDDGGFRVVDTGSLNGTYVNGDRVDDVRLRHGCEVQIGKFRLTFYVRGTV